MESQSRDALSIVSYYVAGGPEYCAKKLILFHLNGFSTLKSAKGRQAGRQAGGHCGFFTGECGQGANIVDCE